MEIEDRAVTGGNGRHIYRIDLETDLDIDYPVDLLLRT